jgi:hypothetical protein
MPPLALGQNHLGDFLQRQIAEPVSITPVVLTQLNHDPAAAHFVGNSAGIEARIQQLEVLPSTLSELRAQRLKLSGDIFDILDAQRKGREELFKPVQDLIQGNSLIREEYKLQFQATLAGSADSIATALFTLIKQNSGEFRGEDESFAAIKKLAEEFDFNTKVGSLGFISGLHDKIKSWSFGIPINLGPRLCFRQRHQT